MLSKKRFADLLKEICPEAKMDGEVEQALSEIADEFIESVTTHACQLARHRNSDILEARDIQLHLAKNWDLRVPGFTHPDDFRPTKRKNTGDAHKMRMDLAKKVSAQKPADAVAADDAKKSKPQAE
eukprot:c9448_g1_i1.p2 GENE.c9448_g1_i1~~c9448_g1_i1.p2  ORF type:complete len:126 (+),score=42.22 c9448_g1_i1:151-528(+)